MRTLTPPPNQPQPEQPSKPSIPARELVTECQVQNLLAITIALQPYLLVENREWSGPPPPCLDGGAHAAAVSTFVVTCQKIEDLVIEPKRWDTGTHDLLYENIAKLQKAQIELFETQRRVTEALEKPSYSLKPQIRLIEGGKYIAYFGDLSTPGGAVIGSGDTPRKALNDFDAAWDRAPIEQLVALSAATPTVNSGETPTVNSGAAPLPKRKKKI